jgi:hypothetical protein
MTSQNDERAAIELDEQQLKKNPLWNHVVLLEKASSGGNAVWTCKYCNSEYKGSYSRVKSHLLRITGGGIKICPKVSKSILAQLKNEVAKAADEKDKSKPKDVPLPVPTTTNTSTSTTGFSINKRSRRGSALEKAFDMETRNQLDAMIARLFYSGGLQPCTD